MKRDVALRALSADHHHALVLARHIAAACARGAANAELIEEVSKRFEAEIRPHFATEDSLLAALEGRGVDDLVARTRDEHRTMLELLESARATDPAAIGKLGELLTAHVRFEERELYPACEQRLTAADLARACQPLEARVRASVEAYVAAWNERDAAKRMQLIEQACAEDLRMRTPGKRIDGRAQLDALIADFQARRPGQRALLSSAIDVQGHVFRYSGIVEGASAPGGDALDTGECDEDGRICVLLTFVGVALPSRG